jgi:Tfp pilus assembly protein PilV
MKRSIASDTAFSLVEVTLALGIAAFCLIAIFGLMPVGVQTNRNATSQTAATNIVAAVVADLRATPTGSNTSSQFAITFGTDKTLYFDSSGQSSTSLGNDSRYRFNITWSGSSGLRYGDLKVTWPGAATPTNASGSVETFAAFDRN